MGTGITFIAPAENTDDATFQNWTQQVHDSLLATGLADVSASGAISESQFPTLSAPVGTDESVGFVVYSLGDSLQATVPIFMKLEYGSGGTSARIGQWITVGTQHDDSGSIAGQVTSREQIEINAQDGDDHQWFVGGDGSYITQTCPLYNVEDQTGRTLGYFWALERTKDSSGTDTGEGFMLAICTAGSTFSWYTVPTSGSIPSKDAEFPMAVPTRNPATFRGQAIVSPAFPVSAISPNPSRNILSYRLNNFMELDIIPVTIYPGIEDEYVAVASTYVSVANDTNARMLIRWT